jgi:hypothetical protein
MASWSFLLLLEGSVFIRIDSERDAANYPIGPADVRLLRGQRVSPPTLVRGPRPTLPPSNPDYDVQRENEKIFSPRFPARYE